MTGSTSTPRGALPGELPHERFQPDQLTHAQRVHIMGVGGTAMGTFAGMLASSGVEVRGSDVAPPYPPMSDQLAAHGIPVMAGYGAQNLDWGPDLVVVGNVIRRVNPEAVAVRARRLPHVSFPEAFGALLLRDRRSLVVTGTHGKTTTTSLLAWLLTATGHDPSLFVGGVPLNFGRSYRLGAGPHFVVEGDEYDTAYFDKGPKFLHYRPAVAVITNIEFDHADIFANVDVIETEFRRLAALVPKDGRLVVNGGCARSLRAAEACRGRVETFGTAASTWQARDLQGSRFTLVRDGEAIGTVDSPLYGRHNVENALAALAVAIGEGVPAADACTAISGFLGVKKRHEVKGVARGVTVLDDFAHHPTAVRETLAAIVARFLGQRVWVAFEIESNTSRRKVFQAEWARAFQGAHTVLFCKPFDKPDNLPPEERIDLEAVIADLTAHGTPAHVIPEVDDLVGWLVERVAPGDVVVGMSGRAFSGFHQKLLQSLEG